MVDESTLAGDQCGEPCEVGDARPGSESAGSKAIGGNGEYGGHHSSGSNLKKEDKRSGDLGEK